MSQAVGKQEGWEWNTDKTSFWLKERNNYFTHRCESCKKDFNYPVPVSHCPVCSSKIEKCRARWVGRIEPPSEKEWNNSTSKQPNVNPELAAMARQELAANPVQEAGFDWQHLRDNL